MSSIREIIEREEFEFTPSAPELPKKLVLGEDALIGVAGRVVKSILPRTEADTIGLLVHLLAVVGAFVGRNVYATADGHRHYCNLFFMLIGETSKGRKGTSWGRIKQLIADAFPDFISNNIRGGMSSGEGIIWDVRDGDPDPDSEDVGISDKRRLIIEPEITGAIRQMKRMGNILSQIIRLAWDGGILQAMVRHNSYKSTGAHISIIGHAVMEELLQETDNVWASSGAGNRFINVHSERSKILPRGGGVVDNHQALVDELQNVLSRAEATYSDTCLDWSPEGGRLWDLVYERLSTPESGMVGRLTNRAEAQVLRLSLLYAVLDGAMAIEVKHLKAGIAVWEYSLESVRRVWGSVSVNLNAEKLVSELAKNPDGMSRTEIHRFFKNHLKSDQISKVIEELKNNNKIEETRVTTDGKTKDVVRAKKENSAN